MQKWEPARIHPRYLMSIGLSNLQLDFKNRFV